MRSHWPCARGEFSWFLVNFGWILVGSTCWFEIDFAFVRRSFDIRLFAKAGIAAWASGQPILEEVARHVAIEKYFYQY